MSALPQRKYVSPEEYLTAERESLEKHEFFDGEIFQMAGASLKHIVITGNLAAELHARFKGRDCRALQSDMRVHIPKTGLFTYPDIAVVCGKPEFLPDEQLDTLTNPVLIIEVLSASTEGYDKGVKFDNYRSLESLREYVLISQDAKRVIRYTKQTDNSWVLMDFIDDKTEIELVSIECSLTMDDIYDKVEFTEPHE
ncbi:MAG TPA: Uma2 family endonuclease [Pyrinomonadaceae bacterium]|nr:Uma2 family endonuclease [Pyrinomonadaceae bacterium]